MLPDIPNESQTSEFVSIDLTDQSRSSCSPKVVAGEPRESISMASSNDDDTEQAISLNINKKSNWLAYKGENRHTICRLI